MTVRAHLLSWFPALIVTLALLAFCLFVTTGSIVYLCLLLAVAYVLPALCFRVHDALWPLQEGLSRLDEARYSPWWGAHQIQLIYDAAPFLEGLLRIIPGLYSAWLRLWGSRVGSKVYWTPRVEITDRSMMVIGDRVVFGHQVACYPHVVSRKHGRLVLLLKRVRVDSDVFLGAGSRLGPGAHIRGGTVLPALTDVGIGESLAG
ncbi:MAG: acyltransferase [Gammaproteobacteria bacterium]